MPWCQHVETELFQVMQLVLAAADRHRTNPELAYSACAVLELFLGEPEMRQLAAGFQAARLVAGMMRQFPQNIDVQESAIGCLCLLGQDERNYELLKEHNCLEPALDAMQNFPLSLQVQQCSCSLIAALGGDDPDCRQMLREAEAIWRIISAMGALKPAARLQAEACGAIAALTDEEWEADDRAFVGANGGIRLIVGAMQAHPLQDVQLEAFMALTTLTTDSDNATRFMTDGGPDLMASALERYQSMPEMVTACASLMAQLGQIQEHALNLGQNGFLAMLVKIVRDFPEVDCVQRAAWSALATLVPAGEAQVVEFEGMNAVGDLIEALEKWPDDLKLWESCVTCLRAAIAVSELHANLIAAGSIDMVVHALSHKPFHESHLLTTEATMFLRDLVLANAGAAGQMRKEVINLTGDQQVADAIGRFPQDEYLKELGMDALKLLASPLHATLSRSSQWKLKTQSVES